MFLVFHFSISVGFQLLQRSLINFALNILFLPPTILESRTAGMQGINETSLYNRNKTI